MALVLLVFLDVRLRRKIIQVFANRGVHSSDLLATTESSLPLHGYIKYHTLSNEANRTEMIRKADIIVGVAAVCMLVVEASDAGEAFVTKVRGTVLTIDRGAEDGLEVGLAATIARPPEEVIIHPLTGENLGAPELVLGSGEIAKVSAKAASIRLSGSLLLSVRPGDLVRYTTMEEKMVMEQELTTQTAEQAAEERKKIRGKAGQLAKNIKSIQATIRGLERSIKALDRFDKDVVQPQFNSINKDMLAIKTELGELRETVSLMGSIPVDGIAEGDAEFTEDELAKLKALIEDEIMKLRSQLPTESVEALPTEEIALEELPHEIIEEEPPFFLKGWFLGILAILGLGAVGVFLFLRMSDDGEDDDESEDDDAEEEDFEEDDDEDDLDLEDEEDDIVVEETS